MLLSYIQDVPLRQKISACLLIGCLFLPACRRETPAARENAEVTVAAAANLINVFQQIGPRFEAQTKIHPVFSFASTAQLAQQIENAAPFDVFAAADSQHVEEVDQRHLLLPGSRAVYARGALALWVPLPDKSSIHRLEDLASPNVHVIALANPKLAPYGKAAVEALQHAHVWDKVESKVVYAENINMAKQYGVSHNADAVLTAYSLVLKESGDIIRVDESLHEPILQALGILANSKHPDGARKFADFLLNGEGRSILESYGYLTGR
jgi:molybdate transport system substrate-binding protein